MTINEAAVSAVSQAIAEANGMNPNNAHHYEKLARVALLAASPYMGGVESEWRPIETAPKDGTPFLAFVPDDTFSPITGIEVYWWEDGLTTSGPNPPVAPTHWHPLPAPPALVSHETPPPDTQAPLIIDRETLRRQIEREPEGEIGVGFELADPDGMERLAMAALPIWARNELTRLRALVASQAPVGDEGEAKPVAWAVQNVEGKIVHLWPTKGGASWIMQEHPKSALIPLYASPPHPSRAAIIEEALTDDVVDKALHATVPGGAEVKDWFHHHTPKGMNTAREVIRTAIAAAIRSLEGK